MGSITETPIFHSSKSQVQLIPWDPESDDHVQRMIEQRIICGWKSDMVGVWRDKQREGLNALQWVVLEDSDPEIETKLQKHTSSYPKESEPLSDTATALGGKPRTSNPTKKFIPIGHISLDKNYESPNLIDPIPGVYFIATFFISPTLRSYGIGRAAMDQVETLAISEPLCAKTLALSTVAKEYKGKEEKMKAFERKEPKVHNQDWYARRGYEVFMFKEDLWWEKDNKGKNWPCAGVFMRKDIKN